MTSDDRGDVEFGLVMPFVVCASNDGPYDDQAFVAGYECGHLAARLQFEKPALLRLPVRTSSLPQVDLIAMNGGYAIQTQPEQDGWVSVELMRLDIAEGVTT